MTASCLSIAATKSPADAMPSAPGASTGSPRRQVPRRRAQTACSCISAACASRETLTAIFRKASPAPSA
eukprot:scaffold301_cov243-Pinguiococcus_pyrenoidosus.AAC.122